MSRLESDKKLLISGGLERDVLLWIPFIDHPLSVLKGHKAPIVKVFNDPDNQIVSLSQDKVLHANSCPCPSADARRLG